MEGEARYMWKVFITAPENAAVLNGRYAKSAEEPATLFDAIGQDLASSNQEVREIAFWALVYAMPKLTSILYERAVREPGWRDVGGKDQQMVNRGMDIVTYLHSKLVVEHRFKIGGKYRKDPRPYMKKAITNWESDEKSKREREVLLDDIPDSAPFFEESVIEKNAFEMRIRELRALGLFRSDDELDLFVAAHVDKNRLDEVQKRLGIRSNAALRKRLSRMNKHMIFVRDEVFTILFLHYMVYGEKYRNRIRTEQQQRVLEEWTKWLNLSVQDRRWLNGITPDGMNEVAVQALTIDFSDVPAHICLVAIHRDSIFKFVPKFERLSEGNPYCEFHNSYEMPPDWRTVSKVIWQSGKAHHRPTDRVITVSTQFLNYIRAELSGLYDALSGVPDDYETWLWSDSLTTISRTINIGIDTFGRPEKGV